MSEALAVVTTCWGLLMGLAPLLQVRVIVRERDASGTSLGWILIVLVGLLLWLTYGMVNRDLPIVISNTLGVIVMATLVVTLRIYGQRPKKTIDEVP